MNKTQANAVLCAILSTVAASPEGAPAGILYAAMVGKATLAEYQALEGIAVAKGLVTKDGHLLTITEAGKAIAAKIDAAYAKGSA